MKSEEWFILVVAAFKFLLRAVLKTGRVSRHVGTPIVGSRPNLHNLAAWGNVVGIIDHDGYDVSYDQDAFGKNIFPVSRSGFHIWMRDVMRSQYVVTMFVLRDIGKIGLVLRPPKL